MALPSVGGGRQAGDGNINEVTLFNQAAAATATVTATLTTAQLLNGIIAASPGASAAAYTLPLATDLDAAVVNAKTNSSFDFSIINIDGSGSGVITVTTNTGWTLAGLMTIAATAGTTHMYRARKTGTGTWTLYSLS